ncbi:MAG: hypothetical protein AAGU77_08050 [Bacillota bacterium]
MKKLLPLLLTSVLLLSPLFPAMAFTPDDNDNTDNPVKINLYLVDYDQQDFFGVASLPPADREYAKNEIVAAVAELYIPELNVLKNSPLRLRYMWFVLSGENADLNIVENKISTDAHGTTTADLKTGNVPVPMDAFYDKAYNEISIQLNGVQVEDTAQVYRWLFFAKVTGDNASLAATLYDGSKSISDGFSNAKTDPETGETVQTLSRSLYDLSLNISKRSMSGTEGWRYTILTSSVDYPKGSGFTIYVDDKHRSIGMDLFRGSHEDTVTVGMGVNAKGELGVVNPANPAVLLTSGDLYNTFMEFYEEIVRDKMGLDYFKLGNYVHDSYFENLTSEYTLTVTADIAPFTPYVSIPQNIVLTPPKTDGSPGFTGFVLMALPGAAMLPKKRR